MIRCKFDLELSPFLSPPCVHADLAFQQLPVQFGYAFLFDFLGRFNGTLRNIQQTCGFWDANLVQICTRLNISAPT